MSDYQAARKRVEASVRVAEDCHERTGFMPPTTVSTRDLIAILSAPPVTVEDVARAACDGWSNGNIQYDDCPAHHQDSWLEAGRAVLALFHTEGKA